MLTSYINYSKENSLEYDIMVDCIDTGIFIESTNIFSNIFKILSEFIDRKFTLFNLYYKRNRINKKANIINKIIKKNPRFANKKIKVRGYGMKLHNFESINIDDEIMIINNIMSRYIAKYKDDNRIKSAVDIEKICEEYMYRKSCWDNWYEITIDDAVDIYEITINNIDNSISKLKKSMYDFSSYVNETNINDDEKEKIIITVSGMIKESINKKFDILVMNMEALKYEMEIFINEDLSKKSNELIKNKKEPSTRQIMKTAELYDTITYGDHIYNIYKTTVPYISCFNYGGLDIYLDKDFFNLPKGYQLAILYHEIGHNESGHFGVSKRKLKKIDIPVEDEEKLLKRIKNDIKKFTFHESKLSSYRHTSDDDYYDELLYLLIELDADRFSIGKIGKKLMSNSIYDVDRNMAKGSKLDQDILDYNTEIINRRRFIM